MKKVLINFLGRSNSGPGFTYELANGLVRAGCEVYAVLSERIQNKSKWEENLGIHSLFIETYESKEQFIKNTILFPITSAHTVKNFFKDIEFDVIIRSFFHPWAKKIDSLVKSKKIITICHDPIPHSNEGYIKRKLYRRHIMCSDDIIVLTKSFFDIVHDRYKFDYSNIHYIPHGIMNIDNDHECKHIPFIRGNVNYLFFGRIQSYKGLEIIVQAYKVLCQKYHNISLYIVGSGDMSDVKDELQSSPNIFVYNEYIPDEDIKSYFTIPNLICVLPYTDATQSGVIPVSFEFLVPVIASNTGGLMEQLDDGNIGLLFENKDISDLISKMEMFITNNEVYVEEQKKITDFLPKIGWDAIAERILDFC